jgi:hypothetical protein
MLSRGYDGEIRSLPLPRLTGSQIVILVSSLLMMLFLLLLSLLL